MSEARKTPIVRAGIPFLSVLFELDHVIGFLGRWWRRGPFVIVGRQSGLALDSGLVKDRGSVPILWPLWGGRPQQWEIIQTPHRGEFSIVSVDNNLALDAHPTADLPREPMMWPKHADPHQRWRFHRTDDGLGFIIESVLNGQVLDIPRDAEKTWKPTMWDRHNEMHQQFLVLSVRPEPSRQ